MGRIFQPLLFMLARCTRNELIRQIEFLKVENEILRDRLNKQYLKIRPAERARLLELGKAIGPSLRQIMSIVNYPTFVRWLREERQQKPIRKNGRPATPEQLRELVIRIARETGWGYTRILGELKKLGVPSISRQTVVNILKANGPEPGPRQGPGTWDEFLKMHAHTLWQCDFFSKRILSRVGMPQVFALVFLNVATRRVWISTCTKRPTSEWVQTQARSFIESAGKQGVPPVELVTRDNDSIYREAFDQKFQDSGVKVRRLAIRAPNTNAYVERFIQSLQVECLDHFLAFGEKHLDYLVREHVEHYHTERPHQALGNRTIAAVGQGEEESDCASLGEVRRRTRLGGLLSHYARSAA
jgi:putative transposase